MQIIKHWDISLLESFHTGFRVHWCYRITRAATLFTACTDIDKPYCSLKGNESFVVCIKEIYRQEALTRKDHFSTAADKRTWTKMYFYFRFFADSSTSGSLLRWNSHFVFLMCVVHVLYCVCSFVCCVLFWVCVLICVFCVYCSITTTGYKPICSE